MILRAFIFLAAFMVSILGQETQPVEAKESKESAAKPAQVTVDVLMISLPIEKAVPLLPQLRDPKGVDAAQDKLLQMVAAKDAVMLDWLRLTGDSDRRHVSESIVEQRYPIEFEQPQVPGSFGGKVPNDDPGELLKALGMIIPTTFETRNCGGTLEAEPEVAADGSSISMQFTAQHVRLLRMEEFRAGKDVRDRDVSVAQPIFRTAKVSSQSVFRNHERRLIFTGTPTEPGGEMILFIMGVEAGAKERPTSK